MSNALREPLKIVLTGGPAAGKSTILNHIQQNYNEDVVTVPEAAQMLLANGFPVPGSDLEWSEQWQQALQDAVLPLQQSLEDSYSLKTKRLGKKILVCDRGLLDGAAYTPGGLPVYIARYHLDYYETLERYQTVWHLGSTALTQAHVYQGQDRMENLGRAQFLDNATLDAWKHHANRVVIPASEKFMDKVERVDVLIDTLRTNS